MNEILVSSHIPSDNDLERLNLFPGRHMGEDEFERQQAYVDRRLANVFAAMPQGIVQGLEVRSSQVNNKAGLVVTAGLGVAGNGQALGLYYPLYETWETLIQNYLDKTLADNPMGVFYLTLERNTRYVDEDTRIHPEQRTEFDPTRDARRLIVGNLGFFRLAIDPEVASGLTREQVENTIAAMHVDTSFLDAMKYALPLGLVFVDDLNRGLGSSPAYGVRWFSAACGQYRALPNSGHQVLLNQTREAFGRIVRAAQAQSALTVPGYISANLRMDFLPAAGELPVALLRNLASRSSANPPGIEWLPAHIAVDIVPVPEESVPALIDQHLGRRLVDLRQGMGERLRLLLAVNEPDYKPDLLDVPQVDQNLKLDLFRYFMRAYDIWAEWRRQFDVLYHLPADAKVELDPAALEALDLPKPLAYPQFPIDFYTQLVGNIRATLGLANAAPLPYPYDEHETADIQAEIQTNAFTFYRSWITRYQNLINSPTDPRNFPAHENPNAPTGLIIQYTDAQVDLDALDTQIRVTRSRIERTRDYLLLQRQQLDNQTVSLAALAGGVAGDGSGLQVARWLPYTQLKASKVAAETTQPETEAAAPEKAVAAPLFKMVATNFINLKANTSIASTAQQLASKSISTKLASNNLVFSSVLRKSPSIFAPLQFNLNNARLDKIAEAPRQALTKPSFDAKEFRFGVLEHIRPEVQEYKKAVRGLTELISTLRGMFDASEAKQLESKLKGFGVPMTYEQIITEIQNQSGEKDDLGARLYEELFKAGKILTQQIAWMEARYEQLEAKLQGLLRARLAKEDEIEKLIALIRAATERLTAIDKRRSEFLGDYGVAQRLIDDDMMDVYKLNEERTRVLTKGIRGLFYVRACQTPVGEALADPLLLRYAKARDIVPGCDSDIDPDLPDDLDDFFETVLEIPMAAWADLQDFKYLIPAPEKLGYMESLRRLRLDEKVVRQSQSTANSIGQRAQAVAKPVVSSTASALSSAGFPFNTSSSKTLQVKAKAAAAKAQPPTPVNISLFGIRQQTQATLHQFSQLVMPVQQVSTKIRQQDASGVISLADLLSTTKGPLQKQAQNLHNRLEQAAWCMLEKLNELPPSLRLEWAQLAEDDRLRVEDVAYWPGLERAERDDFNATRTLAEIVAWWFKQLDGDATALGRAAMRNMVRATLIHASMGDPAEILQGNVQVPPKRFISGALLRLQLNRPPKPGTLLQLLDPQQRVIALLNVDDHDEKGTVARISQLTHLSQTNLQITTQFRVVASKATAQFNQSKK